MFAVIKIVVGIQAFFSFVAKIQVFHDYASHLMKHLGAIEEYLTLVLQSIYIGVLAYRSIVYPLVGLLPFRLSPFIIDLFFTFLLSASISRIAFRRAHRTADEAANLHVSFFQPDERDREEFGKFKGIRDLWPTLRALNQRYGARFIAAEFSQSSTSYLPTFITMADRFIVALSIFLACVSIYWGDLFYRTYFIP